MPSSRSSALPSTVAPRLPLSFAGAFVALLCAALAMSVSPTFVRLADVGPFASAFWRVFLALPVLWVWTRRAEAGSARTARSFNRPTLLAGVAFAGDLFFWHLAIQRTTIANATFFATTAPVFVVVFGWLLFGTRVRAVVLLGLALCLAGGSALVAQSFTLDPRHLVGDGLGIATALFFGLYFLAVEAARETGAGAARTTFELSVVASALLFVVALALEPTLLPHGLRGWAVLCALAFVSHVGGQGLLSVALGRLPAVFSSLVIFLESIAAAIFAWVILGEPVSLLQAVGGLFILLGIWTARPRDNGPA